MAVRACGFLFSTIWSFALLLVVADARLWRAKRSPQLQHPNAWKQDPAPGPGPSAATQHWQPSRPHAQLEKDHFECVVPDSSFRIFVSCPMMSQQNCWENCEATRACSGRDPAEKNCVPAGLQCDIRRLRNNARLLSIDLRARTEQLNGFWSCTYGGQKSEQIFLEYQKVVQTPETTTTTTMASTTTSTTTTPIPSTSTAAPAAPPPPPTKAAPERVAPPEKPSGAKTPAADERSQTLKQGAFLQELMRPEVILLIVVLLALSLLINVGFCMRCALSKCYNDAKRRRANAECLSANLGMPNELYATPQKPKNAASLLSTSTLRRAHQLDENSMHQVPLLQYATPVFTAPQSPFLDPQAVSVKPYFANMHASPMLVSGGAAPSDIYATMGPWKRSSQNGLMQASFQSLGGDLAYSGAHPVGLFRTSVYDDVASTTNTAHSFRPAYELDHTRAGTLASPPQAAPQFAALREEPAAEHSASHGEVTSTGSERTSGVGWDANLRCDNPGPPNPRQMLDEAGNLLERVSDLIKPDE